MAYELQRARFNSTMIGSCWKNFQTSMFTSSEDLDNISSTKSLNFNSGMLTHGAESLTTPSQGVCLMSTQDVIITPLQSVYTDEGINLPNQMLPTKRNEESTLNISTAATNIDTPLQILNVNYKYYKDCCYGNTSLLQQPNNQANILKHK